MTKLATLIAQLPGYKIPGSHFRIGSKLHITDFYYAKRYFQNSFFASRMAFNLAKAIVEDIESSQKKWRAIEKTGLTLVGYGLYSELLLSLVEKFLRYRWNLPQRRLNHCLIRDSENLEMIHQVELLGHFIIIVPIASTFSTSVKIQQKIMQLFAEELKRLRKLNKEPLANSCIPLEPHYNILYISDGEPNDTCSPLEAEFGWTEKKPADKTIRLQFYSEGDGEPVNQKYFLALASKWNRIDVCGQCFPELEGLELNKELPLFETDKTAVTPTLIFNLPEGRSISRDDLKRPFELRADMIVYGHHERNNSHFLFSVNTDEFLNQNADGVTAWLSGLKIQLRERGVVAESDHVMLLSSCHYSNASFINLINEQLFFSAATIIHYDPANDYIQNFVIVYGKEIAKADKILFIDDSLKSGASFFRIADFIEYTLATVAPDGNKKGIAAGIWLLNKAQSLTVRGVQRRMNYPEGIYAFANLHLQTSLSPDQESPLVLEQKRYNALVNDSLLDSLRLHFAQQAAKLDTQDRSETPMIKKERHLRMLEATHLIYEYFAHNRENALGLASFSAFRQQLFSADVLPAKFAVYELPEREDKLSEIDAALLKVLTQSPFVQYEPLKKIVFKWVLELLEDGVKRYKQTVLKGELKYEDFEDIKFLIRRAGLMNSNFIISPRFLAFLEILFSPNGLNRLRNSLQADEHHAETKLKSDGKLFEAVNKAALEDILARLKNVRDFIIFYVAQVKELLLQNETRGVKLEYELLQYAHKSTSPGFNQLIRVLTYENAVMIKRFHEFIVRQPGWQRCYYAPNEKVQHVRIDSKPLADYLGEQQVTGSFRYQNLLGYMNAASYPKFESSMAQPVSDEFFLTYLWLEYFFQFDVFRGSMPSAERASLVMDKIKLLVKPSATNGKVGAFLLVKHASDVLMAYNQNPKGAEELDEQKWDHEGNVYLKSFLAGEKDVSDTYYKSVVELIKPDKKGRWKDSYHINGPSDIDYLESNFLPEEINRLILIRFNSEVKGNETGQALLGLYFHAAGDKLTPPGVIKYLLLMRNSFSGFISSHFESVEYRDWLVSERTKRFVLLSGHGKEMLKTLAGSGEQPVRDIYSRIASNLEQLQQIILSNSFLKPKPDRKALSEKFDQFYHADGNLAIDTEFLKTLKKLAENIYDTPIVENHVDVKIDFPVPNNFTFAFSRNLLELICFELFVNAKKNRWHLMSEDGAAFKNRLKVEFICSESEGTREMTIRISSTGPRVEDRHLSKLNDPNNDIKVGDPVSGTSLIKTLIHNYLNGRIGFENLRRKDGALFGEFLVTITLNEMSSND